MTKKMLAVIIALVVVIGGGIAAFAVTRPTAPAAQSAGSTGNDSESSSSDAAETADASDTPDDARNAGAGNYVDYSDSAIAEAEGTPVLFFHASWCPSCRAIEKDIEAEGVPAGVTVIKVDYDSHQDLRQEYGVTVQTTFVEVTADGDEVAKYTPSSSSIADTIDALL